MCSEWSFNHFTIHRTYGDYSENVFQGCKKAWYNVYAVSYKMKIIVLIFLEKRSPCNQSCPLPTPSLFVVIYAW